MDPQPVPYLERRWVRWSLYIAFWTMLAMINVGQNYYSRWIRGNPFVLWKAMVLGVSDWYMWAALAPLVYQLARRYPLDQRRWSMSLPLHVIVSIIVTAEVVAFTIPFFWYCGDPDDQRRSARSLFLIHFTWGFVPYSFVYWGIVGISHTVDYYQKYRERERRASQLEIQLEQAQLQVLKMQLHPEWHFPKL
jgi:hypothetical protein